MHFSTKSLLNRNLFNGAISITTPNDQFIYPSGKRGDIDRGVHNAISNGFRPASNELAHSVIQADDHTAGINPFRFNCHYVSRRVGEYIYSSFYGVLFLHKTWVGGYGNIYIIYVNILTVVAYVVESDLYVAAEKGIE